MRFLVGALLIAVVGCYDAPRPACGFWCGPAGACPTGYLCNDIEGRCFANGINPADVGLSCPDAGPRPIAPETDVPFLDFLTPGCNIVVDGHEDFTCVLANFNEAVTNVSPATLYVRDDLDQRLTGTVERMTSSSFRIVHDMPLETGRDYRVYAESEIRDLADNRLFASSLGFSFSQPPVGLASTVPVNQTSNVNIATNIVANFTRAVEDLFSNPFLISSADKAFVSIEGTVTFDPPGAPTRAVFDPINQLAPFTRYNVSVSFPQGGGGSFIFVTGPDNLPPTILSRDPIADATNVSVAPEVTATFDEDLSIVDTSTMTLRDGMGNLVIANVAFFSFSNTASLVPLLQLQPTTLYTVTFDVVDLSGNPLTTSSSFTTGPDTVAPRVVSTDPLGTSVNAPRSTNVSITFDEVTLPPDATTLVVNRGGIPVAGTVTTINAGRTWVFTPSAPLAPIATYTVQALGASDAANNTAPTFSWSFMTDT